MPELMMEGITKYFPSSDTLANDAVELRVGDGEIHALVGENGAGKSTLMRILYGLEAPDSGTISLGGREARIASPAAARSLGIGMVEQRSAEVPGLSVAENLVLGAEPRAAALFFDRRRAEREAAELFAENGFVLDPTADVSALAAGELQQLEIAKLLYRKAELLVLDEPTALSAEQEARSLFRALRRLRDAGKTIILITHKVREVKEVADSVTVMRRGKAVARFETKEVDEEGIARLMMGGGAPAAASVSRIAPAAAAAAATAAASAVAARPEVFSLRSVSLRARGRGGRRLVDRASLSVRSGETLGVCGMAGNGLSELEDLASGFVRPSSGEALLEGRPLGRRRTPRLGYVPSDRASRGSCLQASVVENLVALDRGAYFPRGIADARRARAFADSSIGRFSMDARPEFPASCLSGGNLQKLVLARELSGDAPFLLFSNPTQGLDLASAAFVAERIAEARARGAAILLISANLDEILSLSDRVAVMYKGRLVCELENGPGLTRELLGEYMLGLRADRPEVRA